MVGVSLSHYRILAQVGCGGMGAVYEALDTDLGRRVAIKLLKPEYALEPARRERFLREARAAAALSHTNICVVHEVGHAGDDLFIVMQFVEGETLARRLAGGRIDPARLRKIAEQLADALGEAHARGVIHRDVKPSNIMIDANDHVTVVDFGVAAVARARTLEADQTTSNLDTLTGTGQVVGTIGYLSPEQIRGEKVAAATDVFALGITLYEAATGRHPFDRGSPVQTIAAILNDVPPPIQVAIEGFPHAFDEAILHCLDKRADRRPRNGSAVAAALRRSDTAGPTTQLSLTRHRSIAVLPFASLGLGAGDEYLGEALAAEITTRLARTRRLLVISRTSTQRFRGTALDARQIGRELGVQTVLEGEIARLGGQYRITAQLLEVATGFCVWADNYVRAGDRLFDLHDAVGNKVARALHAEIAAPVPDRAPPDVHPDAFRLYMQGKALYYRFNDTDNLLAIEAFRRALSIDPRFARAHAAIASACMARLEREWEPDSAEWIAEALQACERAVAVEPWLSDAYAAKGLVFVRQRRFTEAEGEFTRALAINANDDIAHSMLGRLRFERGQLLEAVRAYRRALKISPDYVWCWNDLAWAEWLLGRVEQTERALRRVLEINPLDEIARVGVATGHYFRGEFDAAIAVAQKSIDINPHHPFPRPVLAVALAARGRIADAEAVCRDVLAANPDDFLMRAAAGVMYAVAGDEAQMTRANDRALLIVADRVPLNLNVAIHFAFLGRPAIARQWLHKAAAEGLSSTVAIERNPLLQQFAADTPLKGLRRRRRDG